MLGINYESSDEEVETVGATQAEVSCLLAPKRASIATNNELADAPVASAPTPLRPTLQEDARPNSGSVDGPAQGPTVAPSPAEDGADGEAAPGSPYSSNRAVVQNLTLPSVPNFDIPPSPPGSPPQTATKKFAQFLDLKKKGVHFNQRLEGSSVLRDPGHLQRLMDFAGIGEEEQSATTLSEDVAVPTVFPEWAYAEQLRASQRQILKTKEQARSAAPREAIDFVSATKSGTSSGTGTPATTSKRKEAEHRSTGDAPSRGSRRSRSRSPKRRR
jgi:hypothetical protein